MENISLIIIVYPIPLIATLNKKMDKDSEKLIPNTIAIDVVMQF